MAPRARFWLRVASLGRVALGPGSVLLMSIVVASLARLGAPMLIRHVIDVAVPRKDEFGLHMAMLGLLATAAVRVACCWLKQAYGVRVANRISGSLQRLMFERLNHVSMRFFTLTNYSEVRLLPPCCGFASVVPRRTRRIVLITSPSCMILVCLARVRTHCSCRYACARTRGLPTASLARRSWSS